MRGTRVVDRSSAWTGTILLLILALALCPLGCKAQKASSQKYHCPMHPTYISDRMGDCPICGMRLVPLEKPPTPPAQIVYTCPMHPEVRSDKPGKCPKCGMDLGVQKAEALPPGPTPSSAPPGPLPPGTGRASVSLMPEAQKLAGIQTSVATIERLAPSIRTVGFVVEDETRIRHIHTRISGWVDKLFVNTTGQTIEVNDPVLTLYSPELLASQEEFILAKRNAERFAQSELPEVRQGGADLLSAARKRLALFGVPDSFVEELDRSGVPQRTVALQSSVAGTITSKQAYEGQQVDPDMELFTVSDLSQVWIEADFYENEARSIRVGQEAIVSLPYDPTLTLTAKVSYVYATLAAESRTLKVRFDAANPKGALKPGMYVNVALQLDMGETVIVPDSAVMHTGERQVVFVEKEPGQFEPRPVTVGSRFEGRLQVMSGLSAGERVATKAAFLLDSESRLRDAIQQATSP